MRRMLMSTIRSIMLGAAVGAVVLPRVAHAQLAADKKEQPAAPGASVPVKAVVLFSSGVGYFEHYGTVKGKNAVTVRIGTTKK